MNYLIIGPSPNHLEERNGLGSRPKIFRTKPSCLPASQPIAIKSRQKDKKMPPGSCPLFNRGDSFAEHAVRSRSTGPSAHALASPRSSLFRWLSFFPLLLPTAPGAHQPVVSSQELIGNLTPSHAIVMQLVRPTPAESLPSTLWAPKMSVTLPSSRGSRPGWRVWLP